MAKIKPISHKLLRRILDPKVLKIKNTDSLKPLTEFIGQERALEAIEFGLGIKSQGYNLFAMGPSGTGKRSLVRKVLENFAKNAPTPPDLCYIHNFLDPDKPIALVLPAGVGSSLQQDLKTFIAELSTNILTVFESDEYNKGLEEINETFNAKREKTGQKADENTKTHKIPFLYKERHQKEKELQHRFVSGVVNPSIAKLKNKYSAYPQIVNHLDSIKDDIITHVNDFVERDESTNVFSFALDDPDLVKYQVNLLVDNNNRVGVPVIFEENPSFANLICRIEYAQQYGNLVTNFMLIRAGAVHHANGGYLMIEAEKIKKEKKAWAALKRILATKRVIIEPIDTATDSPRSTTLSPQPFSISLKVILLGTRKNYYAFCNHDHDFNALFKVVADFDETIERNQKNIMLYARLIATIIKIENLKTFDVKAVAEVIDYSTLLAGDVDKLSTCFRDISDIILEADYWASNAKHAIVTAGDVKRAVDAQVHRLDRSKKLYYEDIKLDAVLIKTSGAVVGQVNCLSVVKVGKFYYGHPTRVTARVRLGKGEIIDIQREIKMSGPIHNKASLTISSFIASRYSLQHMFALHASISFEQIYGSMDGDSASVGEVCALLSAITEVPLKQSFAVTGSIDQHGEVQAIGSVNDKIEGFFDVCKDRHLTGQQGVIIPAVNVRNLMLRDDIIAAVKAKRFAIYAIRFIDEAIALLTGMDPGIRDKRGRFARGSFNALVEERLERFSLYKNLDKK